MKDWNKFLIKESEPIITELKKLHIAKAITFYGSIGAGYADKFSDIDIMVFCTKLPSKNDAKKFYKNLGIELWPSLPPFAQGFTWKNRDWTVWFALIKTIEHDLKSFLKDKNSWFENEIANYLDKAIAFWDPYHLVNRWKKRIKKYPKWLKELNFQKIAYGYGRFEKMYKGLQRNNYLLVEDSINSAIKNVMNCVFALNDKYFWSSEWFYKDIEKFKILPQNCLERLNDVSNPKLPLIERIIVYRFGNSC